MVRSKNKIISKNIKNINIKIQVLDLILTKWEREKKNIFTQRIQYICSLSIFINFGHTQHYEIGLFYVLKIKIPWIMSSKHNEIEIEIKSKLKCII